ncbi:MAG: RusA family crossover junction endodeoxyribonuclease [Lachnospiraceae bacterium]|nr:RusA family crossover junction endodeoxyribonuclease [Lachnospiraceae bacterium]
MLSFTIGVTPRTKKNSVRVYQGARHPVVLPSEAYVKYERDAGWFMPRLDEPIERPVNVEALFYMDTARKVDLVNLQEALLDVLVRYRVLADDNSRIVVSMDGSRVLLDRSNPRTEVRITEVYSDGEE